MPIQPRSIRGKVPYDVERLIDELIAATNRQDAELATLRARPVTATAPVKPAIVLGRGGNAGAVIVDPAGAIGGDGTAANPLAALVDGVSIVISANQLTAPGAAGGITQLTGDVTAGPGSGSVVATIADTAVTPGTYGDATNVAQFTVNSQGRLTAAGNVPITFPGAGSLVAVTVLTSGTAATHTFTAATRTAFVRVQGPGGGGGGGDQGAAQSGAGAGGGAGGYSEQWYTGLSGGEAIEYTVGQGGTGGSAGNNAGNPGTTATLWDINAEIGTTITCNVGTGGQSMAAGTAVAGANGGGGGTATGGYLNINGQHGAQGIRWANNNFWAGFGSSGPLGQGGEWRSSGTGQNGDGYGSGGAGAGAFSGTSDFAGGNGANGVIIIWEFS